MRDYDEILNSMRICLNVDRDSNCLSECFGCKYITHDHHVMDMVREAADAIEELVAQRDGLLASALELMYREDLCKWFKCHNSDTQKEAEK